MSYILYKAINWSALSGPSIWTTVVQLCTNNYNEKIPPIIKNIIFMATWFGFIPTMLCWIYYMFDPFYSTAFVHLTRWNSLRSGSQRVQVWNKTYNVKVLELEHNISREEQMCLDVVMSQRAGLYNNGSLAHTWAAIHIYRNQIITAPKHWVNSG